MKFIAHDPAQSEGTKPLMHLTIELSPELFSNSKERSRRDLIKVARSNAETLPSPLKELLLHVAETMEAFAKSLDEDARLDFLCGEASLIFGNNYTVHERTVQVRTKRGCLFSLNIEREKAQH